MNLPTHANARSQSGCASLNEGRIRDDEHRFTEEADERQFLQFEEERLRLMQEKKVLRLTREESTGRRNQGVGGAGAECSSCIEGPRRDAWSKLKSPLDSMIKKVGQDQNARYEKFRSSADGLIQIKREETDPSMPEISQLTVKPRLSAL